MTSDAVPSARPSPHRADPKFGSRLIGGVNSLLTRAGLTVCATWRFTVPKVRVFGEELSCFCHAHNCGFPPNRMTERGVELALADRWLSAVDSRRVVEIGAVTPYYWPHRVGTIVDPYDPHPLVTDRRSIFDVALGDQDVLSISTFEHIGTEDYGPGGTGESALAALRKVFDGSRRFLITVPYGFHRDLDAAVFVSPALPSDVRITYLARSPRENQWAQVSHDQACVPSVPFGAGIDAGVNGLAVLDRGGIL